MAKVTVIDQKGKEVDTLELDAKVFDGKISDGLMHQAVVTYLANRRQGTASTRTRGEVSGGGKKPWRQKGTGRSRHGSSRSPIWKGGGVTFGPKMRDYSKKFPRRMKIMALKSALNAQLKDDGLMVIDELKVSDGKTKALKTITGQLRIDDHKVCFVTDQLGDDVKRAARNIAGVAVEYADNLSTYVALNCNKLVFTRQSLLKIEEKIKKWLK